MGPTLRITQEDYSVYELKIFITHDSNEGFVGTARYEYPNSKQVFIDDKPLSCTVSSFNRMDILYRFQQWAITKEHEMIERYLEGGKVEYI